MAWSFDGINDEVQITDNAALDLPSAGYSLGGWLYPTDTTGSSSQYMMWHAGASPFNPRVGIAAFEDSNALANQYDWDIKDADGDDIGMLESGAHFVSGAWAHVLCVRSGNTLTAYINGTSVGTNTNADVGNVQPAATLYLGSFAGASNYFTGYMAEWAKWDRALSAGEIAALAKYFAPSWFPSSLAWYLPMIRPYTESRVPLTVTNNGSTVSAHPAMLYPYSPQAIYFAAAIAGISIPVVQHHRRIQGVR